jgi:hypothetical protein
MLFLGVGQAEAKDFTGGSVDWQQSNLAFMRRKTGKPFTVPIYPWAKEFIHTEMEPRLKQGKPVFEWRNPRKALETACQNSGLARVEIRSLRRTLIIHLIQMGASGSKPSPNQAQAFAAALFELHGQWTTNGNDVIFSRARWPASLKALKVNGLEVNRFWARASRREDGPWGIWWSSGYQVQRQHTNDTAWTLYRVHSFGGPGMKGFRWRSGGTAVTNAPCSLIGRCEDHPPGSHATVDTGSASGSSRCLWLPC